MLLLLLVSFFLFLVGYVGERPWWPIQCLNENNKGKTISRDLQVLQQETGHNTKTLHRTQVRGRTSIVGGSSLSLKYQFPEPLVF